MRNNPAMKLEIRGHSDGGGEVKVKKKISIDRAESVKDYLVQTGGIEGQRLKFIELSDHFPVANNETEGGSEQNRRVEIIQIK